MEYDSHRMEAGHRDRKTVAVCGSTGRVGGAVARSLLEHGWNVRALTRKPRRSPAGVLAGLGAEVVEANMDDPASLRKHFAGAHGVFSVQNGLKSGFDKEVRQGRNVADAAQTCGIRHLVYLSAAIRTGPTGVRSWDSKLAVEAYIREIGLPVTVLWPTAFMELMTDKAFSPAVGTWNLWPRLMGRDKPVPWIAVSDIGSVAERVFAEPGRYLDHDLSLAADVRTLAECRSIYEEVAGHAPHTSSMPRWVFDLFTRKDLTTMWAWLSEHEVPLETDSTRNIVPSAVTVGEWLATRFPEQTRA
jgi:uncharacterized protein YbjT (DUF2867 family)